MKLESHDSAEIKARWKIVRRDTYDDVEGEIVAADEASGECSLHISGETKAFHFGPDMIAIVRRKR